MLAAQWRDQPPAPAPGRGPASWPGDASNGREQAAPERRVWPRNLAIAVIIGALAYGIVNTLRPNGAPGAARAATADSTSSATAEAASPGTPSASAGTADTAGAADTGAAGAGAVSQIPVSQLFPQSVKGTDGTVYTLVTAGALNNCIDSDMVGPTLAGLFAQSHGCVGGEGALYKDAAKDQFNMTVFTLKDPADTISIVTALSMSPADFEVGALRPPAGSGLAALSATSGIIQQFAGSGRYLGVFMAQWSDGRASDYADLQKLLNPLQDAVSARLLNGS